MSVDPDFEVTYGGKAFVFPSRDIIDHCEDYFADHYPEFTTHPSRARNAGNLHANYQAFEGKQKPAVRLNRFFYPTGYDRWGWFCGVLHGRDVETLSAYLYRPTESTQLYTEKLRMKSGSDSITVDMYMLPPIRLAPSVKPDSVAGTTHDESTTLYLVVLVDERYFMSVGRYTGMGLVGLAGFSVEQRIDSYPSAYDANLYSPVASAVTGYTYRTSQTVIDPFQPETYFATGSQLASAANNIGFTIVRYFELTGGYYYLATRWKTANALALTDKVGLPTATRMHAAGSVTVPFDEANLGTIRAFVMPRSVTIAFPMAEWFLAGGLGPPLKVIPFNNNGLPDGKARMYYVTGNLGSSRWGTNGTRMITTHIPALIKELNTINSIWSPGTFNANTAPFDQFNLYRPHNSAALRTLADQMVDDFYHRNVGRCDLFYGGVFKFDPRWAIDATIDFATAECERTTTRLTRSNADDAMAIDIPVGLPFESWRTHPNDTDDAAPEPAAMGQPQLVGMN